MQPARPLRLLLLFFFFLFSFYAACVCQKMLWQNVGTEVTDVTMSVRGKNLCMNQDSTEIYLRLIEQR